MTEMHDAPTKQQLPNRKPTRLKNFDYNTVGAYFITICTADRREILSRIVGAGVLDCPPSTDSDPVGAGVLDCPHIELTGHGKIAEKYIRQLSDFYDHLLIESYVIMPNHIHLLLLVRANRSAFEGGQSRTPVPTNVERANNIVSQFVSTFKRFCNKEYGENIWQSRFYDHVIRDRKDYDARIKYIHENPMRWYYDELYAKE